MSQLVEGMTLAGRRLTKNLRCVSGRQVFLAVDLADENRRSVIKTAPLGQKSHVARLAREFQASREAAGPGVATVKEHAVLLSHGLAYMALVEHGPSLASVQAGTPDGKLGLQVAVAAAHGAAVALAQLHDRGWRHGDVKPGNLLCNAAGDVILTDLEFAADVDAQVNDEPDSLRVTGTPAFVAPELWERGMSGATFAADIWALGATLYVLLTGEFPFGKDDERGIAEAIRRGPPPRLATMPEGMQQLMGRLLSVDRQPRPRHGAEAGQLIAMAAERLGCDLAAGKLELGRLAAAAGADDRPRDPATSPGEPPANSSSPGGPIDPPTLRAPEPPEVPLRRTPKVAEADPTSSYYRRESVGAAYKPIFPYGRPEGVGAGDSPNLQSRWERSRHLDVSSKVVDLRPQVGAAPRAPSVMPAPHISLPSAMPSVAAAPAVAPPQLKRKAAARWYRRMNPQRNFPLSVVFSGKQIRIVGGSGLGITLGEREIELDPNDPVLTVEPRFPGCLISPERADVTVSEETVVCRFWITPLVCGDLSEACVSVRYRGKVVETLQTPTEVVTRTLAKALAMMSLVSPVVSKSLDLAGWNLDDRLRQWLPYAADAVIGMGPVRSGLMLGGALLCGAAFHLYVTRPLLSEEAEPGLLPQGG